MIYVCSSRIAIEPVQVQLQVHVPYQSTSTTYMRTAAPNTVRVLRTHVLYTGNTATLLVEALQLQATSVLHEQFKALAISHHRLQ